MGSANFETGLCRIKGPNVVAQVIDGEALLIAFETGTYYSSRGAGGLIVEALQHGALLHEIVGAFAGVTDTAEIHSQVLAFLAQLSVEGLMECQAPELGVAATRGGWRPMRIELFDAPVLEKYTDLEDLLLLDPIHDVDSAGWPVVREPQ